MYLMTGVIFVALSVGSGTFYLPGLLPQACNPLYEPEADPLFARYTLVFDREAYSPKLFGE
ncbi:MAG: hypothetical protein PHI28_10260 [Mangrovibacterium sp.]|nr:hypothetical protein [Mangrovibacterium sp.]